MSSKDGLDYVWIPDGTFRMGCAIADSTCGADEKPAHPVTLMTGYWMGRTEVPAKAFRKFVDETGHRTTAENTGSGSGPVMRADGGWSWGEMKGLSWKNPLRVGEAGSDEWPAVQVSWEDARAYCRWAGGRLPTEAEWERAARGGEEGKKYVWGDEAEHVGNRNPANVADESAKTKYRRWKIFPGYDDGYAELAPVGSFAANAYGLLDMAGNVWEWSADWYDAEFYAKGPTANPQGPATSNLRVLRGGSWNDGPQELRLSFRGRLDPALRDANIGIRCVRDSMP